ncbi:MAG: peptidoglycan editing factor PgeF [Pseudomonadales bacterium]|nr:peptidoglycan editing factor PgeF [Pseudomonadales bacterium]
MNAFLHADWPAPAGVQALTTLRHGLGVSSPPFDSFNLGSRCGDEAEAVAENRRQLVASLALPSAPRWLRQVHGVDVAIEPSSDEPEADAAVTRRPGTVLAILTADCLPVVLAARDGGEVALAHAGWRGLCAGVLEATVAAMRTPAHDVIAWLGPAAGASTYEIGAEVFDAFTTRDARAHLAFLPTRPGHWKVDLPMLARQRLLDAGVTEVHGGGQCTISDPTRYFSHRRDGRSGRMATLVWRQG